MAEQTTVAPAIADAPKLKPARQLSRPEKPSATKTVKPPAVDDVPNELPPTELAANATSLNLKPRQVAVLCKPRRGSVVIRSGRSFDETFTPDMPVVMFWQEYVTYIRGKGRHLQLYAKFGG